MEGSYRGGSRARRSPYASRRGRTRRLPLRDSPELFRTFAELDPTDLPAILAFANQHGWLGLGQKEERPTYVASRCRAQTRTRAEARARRRPGGVGRGNLFGPPGGGSPRGRAPACARRAATRDRRMGATIRARLVQPFAIRTELAALLHCHPRGSDRSASTHPSSPFLPIAGR